jgi:hypothetical protein
MDPIELIKMNPKESCSPNRTQRAVLEFFNYIMDIFLQELIAIFEQTDDSVDFKDIVRNYRHKNENNPWVYVLNEAVKEGNPADFSDHEKNRYYTIQKLATRTRYLNLLIMDDNNICREVRNLLLDRLKASDDDGCGKRRRNIHVASVGGGPGYDHIAIWIVFLFIYNMNDGFIDSGSITLTTDVYDLYGEWEDIVKAMNQSMTNTLRIISETDRSEVKTNLFEGNGARTKLCDIREGLDSPVNKELSDSLEQTDIICFSFVIHENASIILSKDENDPLIQGAARDIMERSRIGTIMICTDSNSTCWPSFKAAAECFGWRYLGSSEKGTGIPFGPKEFVVFQRVAYPSSQNHNA